MSKRSLIILLIVTVFSVKAKTNNNINVLLPNTINFTSSTYSSSNLPTEWSSYLQWYSSTGLNNLKPRVDYQLGNVQLIFDQHMNIETITGYYYYTDPSAPNNYYDLTVSSTATTARPLDGFILIATGPEQTIYKCVLADQEKSCNMA